MSGTNCHLRVGTLIRKIRDFQAALQGRFCFQGPFGGNSEAEWKHHAESRRRRNRRFGGSNLESKRLWAADSTWLASPAAQRATTWWTALKPRPRRPVAGLAPFLATASTYGSRPGSGLPASRQAV